MKDFQGEVERIKAIYNAAWEKNWGFVPMTEQEIDHLAEQFKPVVIPDIVPMAEKDGKVVGFGLALPDLNTDFPHQPTGRMFPRPAKLLWALKTERIRRARILLLGILPEYRGRGSTRCSITGSGPSRGSTRCTGARPAGSWKTIPR